MRTVIERRNGRVIKRVGQWLEYGVFGREVNWLSALQGCAFIPRLYAVNGLDIEMEDCGPDLSTVPPPHDAAQQANEILAELKRRNVAHNDIRPQNVTVKDGRLYLIDWQWATEYGVQPPKSWPAGLGTRYRAGWPGWVFDDRMSLGRVVELPAGQARSGDELRQGNEAKSSMARDCSTR